MTQRCGRQGKLSLKMLFKPTSCLFHLWVGDQTLYIMEPFNTYFYKNISLVLPEQVTSRPLVLDSSLVVTQSLSVELDWTQEELIHHTDSSEESIFFSVETAEPQSSLRHITDVAFWSQSKSSVSTAFQISRCFISSLPLQRLVPPTNLTSTGSEQRQVND